MAKKVTPVESVHKLYKSDLTIRFITAMNQIIALRKDGCRTDKDFAVSIGEYQQNISKFIKGERTPTVDQIGRACEKYHISLDWLFFGKGQMFETADINAGIASLEYRMDKIELEVDLMKKQLKKSK